MAMVASLPITSVAAIRAASGRMGFTLPGMMDEPGCRACSWISASPASGPEDIQRRSVLIFTSTWATARRQAEHSTAQSWPAMREKGLTLAVNCDTSCCDSAATTSSAKPAGTLTPVPTADPPMGRARKRGCRASRRSWHSSSW